MKQNEPEPIELEQTRTVAIVGRPNVGKSAMFNRLVRRRFAIVHERAGVTRDRLSVQVSWDNQRFALIDTGGIGYMDSAAAEDVIEAGLLDQVAIAIQDASAIIFVVDVTCGILPLDAEVARRLRDAQRPVFLAVNKCDDIPKDVFAADFVEFGFPVYPVSALHGRGISDLMEGVLPALPEGEINEPENALRVAVVGRPNAGKSSYINRLVQENRVIVSEIAGTTRDSIDVPFTVGHGKAERHYVFVDTAGVRRNNAIKDVVEKFSVIRTEVSIKRADIAVLVLDATEGPRGLDKKMASMIEKHRKGCVILVNKWDLAEGKVTQRAYAKALADEIPFLSHVPVIFASSVSGFNIKKTLDAIDLVGESVNKLVSTGLLNRTVLNCHARTAPPLVRNHRLRIYYCTQIGTRPVRIRLFVNDPKRIVPAYRAYLIKHIRKAFGFEGAPVILQLQARAERDEEGRAITLKSRIRQNEDAADGLDSKRRPSRAERRESAFPDSENEVEFEFEAPDVEAEDFDPSKFGMEE